MIDKFFENILVPIIDWLEKIWRNPRYMCKKCIAYEGTWQSKYASYTKGFNKHHYIIAHKKKGKIKVAIATKTQPSLGQWYWHLHHEKLAEQITEPIENRISYIKSSKGWEVATRLHFMRPVKNPPVGTVANPKEAVYAAVKRAYDNYTVSDEVLAAAKQIYVNAQPVSKAPTQADWEELHKKECFSYCPWNGKTLFPARKHGIA